MFQSCTPMCDVSNSVAITIVYCQVCIDCTKKSIRDWFKVFTPFIVDHCERLYSISMDQYGLLTASTAYLAVSANKRTQFL